MSILLILVSGLIRQNSGTCTEAWLECKSVEFHTSTYLNSNELMSSTVPMDCASWVMLKRAVGDEIQFRQIYGLQRSMVQVACVVVLFGAGSVRMGIYNLTSRALMEHVVVDQQLLRSCRDRYRHRCAIDTYSHSNPGNSQTQLCLYLDDWHFAELFHQTYEQNV